MHHHPAVDSLQQPLTARERHPLLHPTDWPRCTLIPPNARCAASVSRQVGFPIAWLPTPPGWKATNGITTVFQKPIADEYLVRDDLVLEVQSGAAKHEPPGGTREFSWQGARVVMWAGEPQDGTDGAALPWLVRCTWSRAKHPYEVDVFPRPDAVSTLRLQDGVDATRLVFQSLAYAPSG